MPQILKIITVPSAMIASSQFWEALLTAEGAKERPIQIIIGPVTTGGKNLITFLMPINLIISASTKYSAPATTIPPQAYGSFSPIVILANLPVSKLATVEKPPKKAKEEPKNAGTLSFAHRWKNKVPKPAQINVT